MMLLAVAPKAGQGGPTPTATEVFHLRSECAILGEKILSENVIGPALYQSQASHYDPQTNRCYVELTVQTADVTKRRELFHRYLFDGQTGEMLAVAQIEKGEKSGMVFDRQHRTTTLEAAGWNDASNYIDTLMADDRQQ